MSYIGNKPPQETIPVDDSVTTAMLKDDAVTSDKIASTTIVNADVNASAAIAKTKLASLNIVNADVNASAAIAQSKLSLDITNSSVNASAAIAQSKLANVPYYTSSGTEPSSPNAGDIWYDSANVSMKHVYIYRDPPDHRGVYDLQNLT